MIKKSAVLSLICAVGLMTVFSGNTVYAAAQEYPLKVAGKQVTSDNAADIMEDGTVSYDPLTNTLTLDNTDLLVGKGNYGVRAEGDLNIELKGTNKIESKDYYGIAVVAASGGDTPSVIISGNGSLESYGTDAGILMKGNLTISDSANVSSQCGDVTSGDAYGIRVYADLIVCDNAKLSAKAGGGPKYSYGVYAGDDFTLSDNAVVISEAGKGVARSCGAYAISNIYMKDNATLDVKGIDNSALGDIASESYGIRTTHMIVSGGTITATGQGATGISAGIYTQDCTISGGTVTVSSEDAKTAQSVGIQSKDFLIVSDGTLNANGGNSTQDSWGIDASSKLTVTGGVINAMTGTGNKAYGIDTDTMTVSGGVVIVNAGDAVSQSRGIRVSNTLSMEDGIVDIKSGNGESASYGLQTGSLLDITGGTVLVSTGDAAKSSAIHSGSDINITDANIDVTSKGNGIYAPYGTVTIGCTSITPLQNAPGFDATNINVNAVGYGIYGENGLIIDEKLNIPTTENGTAGGVAIAPVEYTVKIEGLSSTYSVRVPANQSVNETYCEMYDLDDFSERLPTTKEGYLFKGFYTDQTYKEGTEYSFNSPVTESITIYAKWEEISSADPETQNQNSPTDSTVESPKTGDEMVASEWMVAMILGLSCITGLTIFKKRHIY